MFEEDGMKRGDVVCGEIRDGSVRLELTYRLDGAVLRVIVGVDEHPIFSRDIQIR